MSYDLVIKSGLIINHDRQFIADIGIKAGKIEKIGRISNHTAKELNAEGYIVFPGLIDPHTHMGIPMMDTFSVDDFHTGTVAAARSGITTIIDFTVQMEEEPLTSSLERRMREAKKSHVDHAIHVNITSYYKNFLDDMEKVAERGARSFKVFMAYSFKIPDDLFFQVIEKASLIKSIVLLHAENGAIIDLLIRRMIERGHTAPIYHGYSRPEFTEVEAVHRAILITEYLKGTLYIVHMTTKRGVMEVERAKKRGVKVFAETCPQYLYFTEEDYKRPDGHYFIASPPLRKEEDREYLWQTLGKGIDTIGTDHAPFTKEQKDRYGGVFYKTPNGLSVIEFSLPAIYTGLLAHGKSIALIPKLMSYMPAKIFGLKGKGELKEGNDADIVIIDPKKRFKVQPPYFSASDLSPFEGMEFKGLPRYVLLRGNFLIKDYNFVGHEVRGEYLEQCPLCEA